MSELALTLLVAPLAAFTVAAALLEAAAADHRHARARELAGRAAGRLGLTVPPADLRVPLAVEVPGVAGRPAASLRYHLATPQEEDARITLVAIGPPRPARLGHLWVDSHPSRLLVPGLAPLSLGAAFDRHFRVYAEADRRPAVLSLLSQHPDVPALLRRLATRTRTCRLELIDQAGALKIDYRDRRLRFPSDVEAVSLDLVALYAHWAALSPLQVET